MFPHAAPRLVLAGALAALMLAGAAWPRSSHAHTPDATMLAPVAGPLAAR